MIRESTPVTEHDLAVETFHVFVKSADLRRHPYIDPPEHDLRGAACPRCGSDHLQCRGYTEAGTPRVQCQDCSRWTARPSIPEPEFDVTIFDRLEEAA